MRWREVVWQVHTYGRSASIGGFSESGVLLVEEAEGNRVLCGGNVTGVGSGIGVTGFAWAVAIKYHFFIPARAVVGEVSGV